MALSERVTNDYDNWTQAGNLAWTLEEGNSKARNTSIGGVTYTSTIEKTFDLTRNAVEATLTVQGARSAGVDVGIARAIVKLKDADGAWHVLYDQSGTVGSTTYLSALDIQHLLLKAGTYTLQFTAIVKAGLISTPPPVFDHSNVLFEDVSLQADTITTYEKLFTETLDLQEQFVMGSTFIETLDLIEHFSIVKTTPAVTKEERLLAGKTDNSVLIFETGTADGYFDTDDEDFGHSGMEKTLDEVQFESGAVSPHTVTIYVSTDSGFTWTSIGQVVAQRGRTCSLFTCITATKHRVRFRGNGLYLSSYILWAIPRGRMPKQ